jgi:hypothetical protein
MALKKIKLSVPSSKNPINPLNIFGKLTLRGSIENIWEPQADALKKWHQNRDDFDIVIQMNTGGGKTLVGLLIAQSLVNETKGSVFYVSANNQLVEQTLDQAKKIGLSPAIRYKGDWTNKEEFDTGNTFCLTNYSTIFNGKSIFLDEDVDALVFDDAHVAENVIRNQFTLHISNDHQAFSKIIHLFRKHFANSSQSDRFDDVAGGRFAPVMFIPMFIIWEHANEIRKLLLDHGIEEDEQTMFAWEYIKEHLNHCCVVTDGSGLDITPVIPPISQLNYFQEGVRRVYLTATLPSQASFARTFGVATPIVIQPTGKSGEAQRLFVFVPGNDDEEQRNKAKLFVEDHKCCLIPPSYKKGQEWVPPAVIYDKDSGQEEITRFCKSRKPEMLGLIARYDGIDLPGDACRILILDRLPVGESLFNRFIDESIRVETVRISHTATRVVQAIGRIFRSNTDHGVVLLVGPQLQSWVRNSKNQVFLPKLLQQQIRLAIELAKQVKENKITWEDLIQGILSGEQNWDEMYNEYIEQFDTNVSPPTDEWYIKMIVREKKAYDKIWIGQYQQAADDYAILSKDAEKKDFQLAAWYFHLRGLALLCSDDRQGALSEFIAAANIRSELGRPSERRDAVFKPPKPDNIGQQAKNLCSWYRQKKHKIPDAIEQVRSDLVYGPETNKAEEALRILGSLLGLHAERAENLYDTGPDVTWKNGSGLPVFGFELKSDKNKDGEYSKKEIAQCHDHEKWLKKKYGDETVLIIVGWTLTVSKKANPSETLRIVEIAAFQDMLNRIEKVFDSVEAGDKTNLEEVFQTWLSYYGLIWPICVESLDSRLASDLKLE